MSRYRGPRLKIIRRLKTLPGLTSKRPKNRKDSMNRSSSRKISQYRIRLEEKQKLRFHYGLTERQLLKYVRIARRAKGSTGQVLLQLLEMRLDNILFRLGMAPTIPGARQLVTGGLALIASNRVLALFRAKSASIACLLPSARAKSALAIRKFSWASWGLMSTSLSALFTNIVILSLSILAKPPIIAIVDHCPLRRIFITPISTAATSEA